MSEETVQRLKRLYNKGKISKEAIQNMLDEGKITEEQYREIVESNGN